jgi:hypothetical protein
LLGWQHLYACRGELDRERNALESRAQLRELVFVSFEAGIHRPRALAEELDRRRLGQRPERVLVFRADAQRLPARADENELRTRFEQRRQRRRGFDDLLQVVEEEQELLVAQVIGELAGNTERGCNRRLDELRIADR